jgi:hypothetical protein
VKIGYAGLLLNKTAANPGMEGNEHKAIRGKVANICGFLESHQIIKARFQPGKMVGAGLTI